MKLTYFMISERNHTAKEYIFYDSNYIKVRNSEIIYGDKSPNSGNFEVRKYQLGKVMRKPSVVLEMS